MKPKLSIYILTAIGLICLAVAAKGQSLIDDYDTKPATRERQQAVVKFHVALELMNSRWLPGQKDILINTVNDPQSIDDNIFGLYSFTDAQVKRIFYAIGSRDISKFKTVYKLDTLADKRLLFVSYDKQGRAQMWRGWFAYEMATHTLTGPQIDILLRFSQVLVDQNPDDADLVARDIDGAFDRPLAREIFGSVGPYKQIGVFCRKAGIAKSDVALIEGGNCVCSKDHYNYSCNDTCGDGGGCAPTDGGCSILWLRNCDGSCSLGELQ